MDHGTTRIGVLGVGAIGRTLAEHIAGGRLRGAHLECVVSDTRVPDPPAPLVDLDRAVQRCDLIVECAGQPAVSAHAEDILCHGTDLVIASIGSLMDEELRERLRHATPGRMYWTSGAIGGLDILAAARRAGPFTHVSITSTKSPSSLVQPWMSESEAAAVRDTRVPLMVFEGLARDAARLFPKSLNVAAAVSLTVDSPGTLEVRLLADPAAESVSHVLEATGPCGSYRFDMKNVPSPDNPRTSRVVPFAMLRTLDVILGNTQ